MSYPYTPPPNTPYPPPYGQPYGQPPVGPYRPPQSRSAIPRVVGILAIVFAPIGLLYTLAITYGPKDEFHWLEITQEELGFFGTWLDVSLIIGVALFVLHLVAGIAAVSYRRSGPPLLSAYAIAALLLVVADVAIALSAPISDSLVHSELVLPRVFLQVFALPWPIIALILINQRSARSACGHAPRASTPV